MPGALAAGFGLGFLTAAQVGPIWLLCLRSTLRSGFRVGIAIGAGAAVIDLAYAALGVAGASRLLEIGALRIALGLAGAAVLAFLGLRTLWSAFSTSSHGTGSLEKRRTERRASISSANSRERASASSGLGRSYASGTGRYGSLNARAILRPPYRWLTFSWRNGSLIRS